MGGPVADPDSLPQTIGKLPFRQQTASDALKTSYTAMEALRDLPTLCPTTTPAVQAALLMLRMCILPKATHLLRSLPPEVLEHVATRFDAEVLSTFQHLMQYTLPLSTSEQAQTRMPIRHGGIGLPSVSSTAPSAFLGSWCQVLHEVETALDTSLVDGDTPTRRELEAAEQRYAAGLTTMGEPRPAPINWQAMADAPTRKAQQKLTRKHQEAARRDWMATQPPRDQARLQSCSGWGAGAPLTAVPIDQEQTMSDATMHTMLRLRLGLPLYAPDTHCQRCNQPLDPHGRHSRRCPGNHNYQHDRMRDHANKLLKTSGFRSTTEHQEPRLRHRPDIRVDAGMAPLLTYLDASFFDPTCDSAPHTTNAQSPTSAPIAYWNSKLQREYHPLPLRAPFRLKPLVASIFGTLHPDTRAFFTECAARICADMPTPPDSPHVQTSIVQRWLCQLGTLLQKENHDVLSRCAPDQLGDSATDRPWSEDATPLWDLQCIALSTEAL